MVSLKHFGKSLGPGVYVVQRWCRRASLVTFIEAFLEALFLFFLVGACRSPSARQARVFFEGRRPSAIFSSKAFVFFFFFLGGGGGGGASRPPKYNYGFFGQGRQPPAFLPHLHFVFACFSEEASLPPALAKQVDIVLCCCGCLLMRSMLYMLLGCGCIVAGHVIAQLLL